MDIITVTLAGIILVVAVAALAVSLRRPGRGAGLEDVARALQAQQTAQAVMVEKLTHIEPVAQSVGGVQVELRGLAERVAVVEQAQGGLRQGLDAVGTTILQTSVVAAGLNEATAAIRSELSRARDSLTELQARSKDQRELEQRTADAVGHLEAVVAGTQTKGAAGENILEKLLAQLPVEWQVRNFRVGDRCVEFGLRLPNQLILPIDSKWAATGLIEQFVACPDGDGRQAIKMQIEAAVRTKAREVKKYLDPGITVNFGVAAVPDAVYELSCGVQAEIFQENVVLVSYSLFVPYLLLVFQMALKGSRDLDMERVNAYLETAQASMSALQEELEGRLPRAITMLGNSREDMRSHLGRLSTGLTNVRIGGRG